MLSSFSNAQVSDRIPSFGWKNNAELIAALGQRGLWPANDKRTSDGTFGVGAWRRDWHPDDLTASDHDPLKSPVGYSVDVRNPPWTDPSR
jgi:hypothetical protein